MDHPAIGRELRARRTAAGRTVASVAADAGLSVPYVANLENGRGNPTVTALTRLAAALGMRLVVTLVPGEESQQPSGENQEAQETQEAQENQPAQQSRAEDTRAGDRSSLEEQPGRDDKADASGQAPVPPPRGEPSASDKKAGSAR